MNSIPELFSEKKECCGCGSCLNICPKSAISMEEDEAGFTYPKINEKLCIKCGRCKAVCAFQNIDEKNVPIEAYAAVSKDEELQMKSASGGIFASIARQFILDGGYVFGAAFDDEWNVKHIGISNVDELTKLQGSKYVQSNTGNTYQEVKKLLQEDKKVLYSGTPCQIAGLKGYLGEEYENLYLVDIICHGVPNNRMLKEYLKLLEKKYKGKVESFTFRDKSLGWGINGSCYINGKKRKIWQSTSSYLYYFSRGMIYRDNCYYCKYTCKNRPGDITIGDYWGIEREHLEYLGKNGLDEKKGISAVVVNSTKGQLLLKKNYKFIELKPSTFEKVSNGNAQLREPSKNENREVIVEKYIEGGWEKVEEYFVNEVGIRKYSSIFKCFIPIKLKRIIKKGVVRNGRTN